MKKLLLPIVLSVFVSASFGATLLPIQLISAAGSTANQVVTSPGPSGPLTWANQLIQSVAGRTGAITLSNTDVSGLGTSATINTGTSGATIPLLNGANTWAALQTFTVRPVFNGNTPFDSGNLTIANYLTAANAATTYAPINNASFTGTFASATPIPVSSGGSGAATLTGLVLGNGTSAFSAYGGTACTNQFSRGINSSGVATCASVANTDLSNSSVTIGSTSVSLGGTAASISGLSLVAPALGTPASGVATNLTGTASALNIGGTVSGNTITTGTGTLTLAAGKTLTANNTLTLAGTDGVTYTGPTTSATLARTDAAQTFTGAQTFSGQILSSDGTVSAPGIAFSGATGTGIYRNGTSLAGAVAGAVGFSYGASTFSFAGRLDIGFFSDTFLYRDAAGISNRRNGTNAQGERVSNTYTNLTNYEWGVMDWTTATNILTIGAQAAGTGTLRNVNLVGAAVQINGTAITPTLTGTSTSIGGSALLAGACSTGTVTITGATTSMVPIASPVTYPGDGFDWAAYVSSANTVTVKVCGFVAGTPTASTYNVRILQ